VDSLILSNRIKEKAKEIGFSLVGFCNTKPLEKEGDHLIEWLNRGYNAEMRWFERSIDKRIDPSLILPNAKSIIVLGLNYYNQINFTNQINKGKISKYALGKDYHSVMKSKMKILINFLKEQNFFGNYLSYVDSGPLMEKALAQKAGLGWIGKNTNLINRKIGSFFFIGCIITDIELVYDEIYLNYCGTCNKCIEACPTKALVEPYILDSNKCISYLTIEYRGEVLPQTLKGKFDNWVFGCDICQDICPWNKNSKKTDVVELYPMIDPYIDLEKENKISEEQFSLKYSRTSIKRAKYKGFLRNINFLIN